MNYYIGCLIGLVLSVSVGAESLLEGRVRLESGQPAAGVQVRLFDLTDLGRFVGTTTDESGRFALSLHALSRGTALPTDFALGQNYPNPFNPATMIPYHLPAAAHVRLEVFNLLGQRLATLVDGVRLAGSYTARWDGTDAAGRAVGAGVYIYRLSNGDQTTSRRMVLVDGQAGIAAAGPVEAVESVEVMAAAGAEYGLTVSGEGVVAYVNPAFRVGVDAADIVLEVHDDSPRLKLATGGILGDVNNDGQVNLSDALYVLLYAMSNSAAVIPTGGNIALGDVNADGRVDIADAVDLVRYIDNPSDPSLPSGIGSATIQALTAQSGGDSGDSGGGTSGGGGGTSGGGGGTSGGGGGTSGGGGGTSGGGGGTSGGGGGTSGGGGGGSTTNVTQLTRNAGWNFAPAWSPDGGRIAFESNRGGTGIGDIYVMNADGSNQTRITQDAGENKFPAWSPDSQRIAFMSNRTGNWDIYVMSADGSNPTNLTNNGGQDAFAAWSPDGGRISFMSDRSGNQELYVMNADGSNPTRIISFGSYSSWSPDGRIAFQSGFGGPAQIHVMSADGSNQTVLTHAGRNAHPAWSPDGGRIAFQSDRDGTPEIYVMNANGSNQIRLTRNVGRNAYPSWSPDSRRIAFDSYRDGVHNIFVLSAE